MNEALDEQDILHVQMILSDLPSGDVLTNVYINDKLILSDTKPTMYGILQALSQHIPGFDLEPLIVMQELLYIPAREYA